MSPINLIRMQINACGPQTDDQIINLLKTQWSDNYSKIMGILEQMASYTFHDIYEIEEDGVIYWTNEEQDPS
jgi:hypothetical protein